MGLLATGTTGLDSGIVTSVIDLVKSVMGLFSEYPMNLILTASLVTVAIGIFAAAKSAAHQCAELLADAKRN